MMPGNRRLFNDVAKLATSAAGVVQGAGREAELLLRQRLERILDRMDLVNRDEFDVVKDMASQLAIDAATLSSTIDRFNQAVQPGQYDSTILDGSHTKGLSPDKTNWALAIDEPPFLAYPLRPGITFTYLGVKINERAQVLNQNNTPFENLTAAGEIMAGNILGEGYCAGTGMTIGGVFGRIAGENAL